MQFIHTKQPIQLQNVGTNIKFPKLFYFVFIQVDGHEQLATLLSDMKHQPSMATTDNNSPVEETPRISTEDFVCLLVEVRCFPTF